VEWRAAAGEQFPSEDVKEQVIFTSFECGFNLPAGYFFRGLLYVGRVKVEKCPKAYSLKRSADPVRS
jgi:hypothetical protein